MCAVDKENILFSHLMSKRRISRNRPKASWLVSATPISIQKMNKIIKSPCYIRESLWIISGQRRGSLSAEQNANEERGTGFKRTTSSSLCLDFCLIIALCKTLHLQSSITTKNSLLCLGEIISLNSHREKKCTNIPVLNIAP